MKTNNNQIYLVDHNENQLTYNQDQYIWASLSQIKALALVNNALNPFVKTIITPIYAIGSGLKIAGLYLASMTERWKFRNRVLVSISELKPSRQCASVTDR